MSVEFTLDGQTRSVPAGTKVSAAIFLANGNFHGRNSEVLRSPRGVFCGIGCCYECLVTIDGVPKQRGCLSQVQPGMKVEREL